MGTYEENILENIVCFIYGGAGARSRTFAPAPTGSGFATLVVGAQCHFLAMRSAVRISDPFQIVLHSPATLKKSLLVGAA